MTKENSQKRNERLKPARLIQSLIERAHSQKRKETSVDWEEEARGDEERRKWTIEKKKIGKENELTRLKGKENQPFGEKNKKEMRERIEQRDHEELTWGLVASGGKRSVGHGVDLTECSKKGKEERIEQSRIARERERGTDEQRKNWWMGSKRKTVKQFDVRWIERRKKGGGRRRRRRRAE